MDRLGPFRAAQAVSFMDRGDLISNDQFGFFARIEGLDIGLLKGMSSTGKSAGGFAAREGMFHATAARHHSSVQADLL